MKFALLDNSNYVMYEEDKLSDSLKYIETDSYSSSGLFIIDNLAFIGSQNTEKLNKIKQQRLQERYDYITLDDEVSIRKLANLNKSHDISQTSDSNKIHYESDVPKAVTCLLKDDANTKCITDKCESIVSNAHVNIREKAASMRDTNMDVQNNVDREVVQTTNNTSVMESTVMQKTNKTLNRKKTDCTIDASVTNKAGSTIDHFVAKKDDHIMDGPVTKHADCTIDGPVVKKADHTIGGPVTKKVKVRGISKNKTTKIGTSDKPDRSCAADTDKKLKRHENCCVLCGVEEPATRYENKKSLRNHILDNHVLKDTEQKAYITCPICNRLFNVARITKYGAFASYVYCLNHMVTKHNFVPPTFMEKYKCDEAKCHFQSLNKIMYERHVRSHKVVMVSCEHCKEAVSKKSLSLHIKTCTKHHCTKCNETFSTRGNLNSHINRIHSKKVKFGCEYCLSSFFNKFDYHHHMFRLHGQNKAGKPVAKCDKCGFETIGETLLKKHMLEHKKGNFPCSLCSKIFGTKSK